MTTNSTPTKCSSCGLLSQTINNLCHACSSTLLDRLTSSCQHLISNWRNSIPELEDKFQPTAKAQTFIATTALDACADRLEVIVEHCKKI